MRCERRFTACVALSSESILQQTRSSISAQEFKSEKTNGICAQDFRVWKQMGFAGSVDKQMLNWQRLEMI